MNYSLLKLRFSTPLHIGDSKSARSLSTWQMNIPADTMFSALCHTALLKQGEDGIKELYRLAADDRLKISDTMPYSGKRFYLPRPLVLAERRKASGGIDRKQMKKLLYIPLDMLSEYISYIRGDSDFHAQNALCHFGESYVLDKVAINGNDKPLPYSIGLFRFDNQDDCGLYIIVGYMEPDVLNKVVGYIRITGAGGIGGKVSSGYGKYEVTDVIRLYEQTAEELMGLSEMLDNSQANGQILITTALPQEEELEEAMEGCTYNLARRGGFIQSTDHSAVSVKKQTQYYFAAGSVFRKRFGGDVYDVSRKQGHPVYRYAKPLFLGVDI